MSGTNIKYSKKKQQKNGFFYFMLDMQQDFKEQGRNISMRDIPTFAGPSWSKLSDAQKQRYNLRAKGTLSLMGGAGLPSSPPSNAVGRRDQCGVFISEHRNPEAEELIKREQDCHVIAKMLAPGKRVTLQSFFFMDIQSLCHIPHKPDHKYIPCEVGVVRYTLNEGIVSKFHKFIKPGSIPMGYRYLAQSTSEATHKIPVEGAPLALKDYRKLLGELESFLMTGNEEARDQLPAVFTKRGSVECVEWCLQWLADTAGVTNRIGHVYEVEALISQLVSHSERNQTVSPFLVEELMKTSSYDHDLNTRCSFHEELDTMHCSLGISHTNCFIITELLCPMYSVSLTRNHLSVMPPSSSKTRVESSAPSRARMASCDPDISSLSISNGRGLQGDHMRRHDPGQGRGRGRGLSSYEFPRPMGRGQFQHPTGRGQPQHPTGRGQPQHPMGRGQPQHPMGRGQPQHPMGRGQPQHPMGRGQL